MKALLALLLVFPLSSIAARLVNLDFGTPLASGRLEIAVGANGEITSLSSVIRKGVGPLSKTKTKTKTMAQMMAPGGSFSITASKKEIGRITVGSDFNPARGGTVNFTIIDCDRASQSHRLNLRLNAANQWRLYKGGRELNEVEVDGPIVTRKCLEDVSFK